MAGQTCALSGCTKPPWPSVDPHTPHLACGNLHHLLLMSSRFSPALPHPYRTILDRNSAGLCALLSCTQPPFSGHSWCSRRHYLLWLTGFISSLRRDQICKLPRCTRHVFVDEDHVPSQFCGWRHEQKFVILDALSQRHAQGELLAAEEAQPQEASVPVPSVESEFGSVHSVNSFVQILERFAVLGVRPTNIQVVEDFYENHPWEVLKEGRTCWLIARLKFTTKGRRLTTKGHYHWKQSGRRAKKSRHTEKYYTYLKRKGKEKEDAEEEDAGHSYTMKEYTIEKVKLYSLVELVKERPSTRGKPCQGQTHVQQQQQQQEARIEISNEGSPDTAGSKVSLWDDGMSVESCFKQLPRLDGFTSGGSLSDCSLDYSTYDRYLVPCSFPK